MKKVFTLILAAALVLSIGATSAFAAADTGANYLDADGDGVCDNRPADGLCPREGTGRHTGRGCGFVDADGDGACDNLGSRPMDGTGLGRRCGRNK